MVIEGLTQSNRAPPAHLGVFAAATLILSWGISFVVIGETIPWFTTVLIMFSPAVVVLSIRRATGHSILRTILSSLRGTTWVSLGFAIIYPVVFIGVAALVALTTGLGTYQPGADNVLREIIAANGVLLPIWVVLNLIIVYGEELGWRGYLLPELTNRWGRVRAAGAVGVVWGLYHAAFLYNAGVVLGVANPLLITVIQGSAAFTMSFAFAYSYYLTDGSVLPAMIMHLLWNIINPWILGDIYANVDGVVGGQVFMINGEGLVGLVIGLVALGGFVVLFRRGILIRESGDGPRP